MSEPIRILNVVGRMDRGGIETLIMNIYRNIDRSKIQFDFLAHYGKLDADYNEEIHSLGGRIYEMPVIKTMEKTYYWRVFSYIRVLKKFFKEHPEYHVVHGHMTNTASIYMPIAMKYGRVTTCIAHSHLTKTQSTVSKMAAIGTNLLKGNIRKCATDYFACSEAAALWIFKQGDLDAGKVEIINNGIDTGKFIFSNSKRELIRKQLGYTDEVVIGHVGRFFPQKNHTYLIDIFKAYHEINPKAILMLVGEGELFDRIKKKVNDLDITNSVRFMGLRSDVEDLMLAMDLFLMPSLYEGLPVVGIEAQATGLPLLVSDDITAELNITGNVSFLNRGDSPEKWAQEINRIVKDYERKSTTEVMGKAGYDIHKTVDFLENFYIDKHFLK